MLGHKVFYVKYLIAALPRVTLKVAVLSADIVLINANVKTMNPNQPSADAVAITKNKIAKVGSTQQMKQLIGSNTQVIDLKGKTVLPGLIDTHIHVADFGRCLMWLDLTQAQSITELQELLKQKTAVTPAGKWVIGQGWNENRLKKLPTTADLDAASPDNPVILYREASMICATNSLAQKLASITAKTQAPPGGTIDRDSEGIPTGIFRDSATNMIWNAVPEPAIDDLLGASELALQKILQAGLTSIHWLVLSDVELEIIQNLHNQDKLPVRVNVVVPENLLEKAKKLQTSDPSMLRFGGVTINVDGYLDSKEAALFEPYSDDPKNRGKLYLSEEALAVVVARVLAVGVQPIILAMGDKAVDVTLNVIEQMPKTNIRFRIEQAAVLNKCLVSRLKAQEVVVSIQPKMISTEFTVWSALERLGVERARWLHPLKALVDAGVKMAGGSDCPMEPLSPLLGVQEVVTRQAFAEQRLSVEEALGMYTVDAAYSAGEERVKGSIEEGKLADLTVLACAPSLVEAEKIKDITVEAVVINGKFLAVS